MAGSEAGDEDSHTREACTYVYILTKETNMHKICILIATSK